MKISRLIIPDFKQFKGFDLDLTHPETGEPLDKVCFIGGNGTGKSTLPQCLNICITDRFQITRTTKYFIIFKVKIGDKSFYQVSSDSVDLEEEFERSEDFEMLKSGKKKSIDSSSVSEYASRNKEVDNYFYNKIKDNNETILVFCPAEPTHNGYASIDDVPKVTLSKALELFEKFPHRSIVSSDTVNQFWSLLIYHLKKRDNDFKEFQNKAENQLKTFKDGKEEFEKQNPDILKSLSDFWNKILAKAGLEFDYEGAKNPIQLTDNLKAYIRLRHTKEKIGYNQLSTGIRNFIFKLGHIFALYFNRSIESGFLLVDEPENSLFPDFLYGLVDTYVETAKNTQIFMATHNPIIAAQFQPYERFILEFEEGTGHVKVRRGTTPVGDDPNDILIKDFGIRSILGREGVKKWERYIELKTLIPLENDPTNKNSMIEEFMQIGSDYNFASDAVS